MVPSEVLDRATERKLEPIYEVVWPRSPRGVQARRTAARLQGINGRHPMEGKRIAFLWDYLFRGDELFPYWSGSWRNAFRDSRLLAIGSSEVHMEATSLRWSLDSDGVDRPTATLTRLFRGWVVEVAVRPPWCGHPLLPKTLESRRSRWSVKDSRARLELLNVCSSRWLADDVKGAIRSLRVRFMVAALGEFAVVTHDRVWPRQRSMPWRRGLPRPC